MSNAQDNRGDGSYGPKQLRQQMKLLAFVGRRVVGVALQGGWGFGGCWWQLCPAVV